MDIAKMYSNKSGEATWATEKELTNIESMNDFLDTHGLRPYIVLNDGTHVLLYKAEEHSLVSLESYGGGDAFNHAVYFTLTSIHDYEDDSDIKPEILRINGGALTEICDACNGSGEGRNSDCRCSRCGGGGTTTVFG